MAFIGQRMSRLHLGVTILPAFTDYLGLRADGVRSWWLEMVHGDTFSISVAFLIIRFLTCCIDSQLSKCIWHCGRWC